MFVDGILAKQSPTVDFKKVLTVSGITLLSLFYVLYAAFFIRVGHGPVDFDTFREIGNRFLAGENPYGPNSLYPMPFVGIFAVLAWLPRPFSLVLFFGGQVISAIAIGGPWVLAFAPTIAIQTSMLGMIGLWGYRRSQDKPIGGLWLAVMLLKPQLGIFPLMWAGWKWAKMLFRERRLPRQVWVFALSMTVFYLPWFASNPNWVSDWLANPRGLRERAMVGMAPRVLYYFGLSSVAYWVLFAAIASVLLWMLRKRLNFDTFVLWSFIISPLVHDYDLIQLIPIADTARLKRAAVLLSIPGWLVFLFAYGNDLAWFVYTIIPVGLLIVGHRRSSPGIQNPPGSVM